MVKPYLIGKSWTSSLQSSSFDRQPSPSSFVRQPSSMIVGSMLVVDTSGTEAIAAAVIFKKMLTPQCVLDGHSPPCILWPRDVCPPSCSKAVLFCTPGCFQNAVYLVMLMKLAVHCIKHITPVVGSESFTFPAPSFFAALEDSVRRLCLDAGTDVKPQLLHHFVKGVFNKICSRLSVHGSIRMLQAEVDAIWEKMKGVDVDDLVDGSGGGQGLIFSRIVAKFAETQLAAPGCKITALPSVPLSSLAPREPPSGVEAPQTTVDESPDDDQSVDVVDVDDHGALMAKSEAKMTSACSV